VKVDVKVPIGKSGDWSVEEFTISDSDAELFNLRSAISGAGVCGNRSVVPGTYKKLLHFNSTVMSNTPAEIADSAYFVRKATGSVLVSGLGLGAVLTTLLAKPEVTSITVLERSEDVIKLVAPTFKNEDRITIIHTNALEWKPEKGVKFDCAWHDIWNTICSDNLEDMKRLHRKYSRRCKWQLSWCRRECERQAR